MHYPIRNADNVRECRQHFRTQLDEAMPCCARAVMEARLLRAGELMLATEGSYVQSSQIDIDRWHDDGGPKP